MSDVFNYFKERTPGTYTEKQEYSLKWYYDNTQSDFGSQQARELLIHLWAGPLVNSEAEVVLSTKCITVRSHECSRATCMTNILTDVLGERLDDVDFAACFSQVPFRDDDVYQAVEDLVFA